MFSHETNVTLFLLVPFIYINKEIKSEDDDWPLCPQCLRLHLYYKLLKQEVLKERKFKERKRGETDYGLKVAI